MIKMIINPSAAAAATFDYTRNLNHGRPSIEGSGTGWFDSIKEPALPGCVSRHFATRHFSAKWFWLLKARLSHSLCRRACSETSRTPFCRDVWKPGELLLPASFYMLLWDSW